MISTNATGRSNELSSTQRDYYRQLDVITFQPSTGFNSTVDVTWFHRPNKHYRVWSIVIPDEHFCNERDPFYQRIGRISNNWTITCLRHDHHPSGVKIQSIKATKYQSDKDTKLKSKIQSQRYYKRIQSKTLNWSIHLTGNKVNMFYFVWITIACLHVVPKSTLVDNGYRSALDAPSMLHDVSYPPTVWFNDAFVITCIRSARTVIQVRQGEAVMLCRKGTTSLLGISLISEQLASRHATVMRLLLLVAGDVERNPGPVQSMLTAEHSTTSTVRPYSNIDRRMDRLMDLIEALTKQVQAIQIGQRKRYRQQGPFQTRSSANWLQHSTLCYYHRRFGKDAINCAPFCTWRHSRNSSAPLQRQRSTASAPLQSNAIYAAVPIGRAEQRPHDRGKSAWATPLHMAGSQV